MNKYCMHAFLIGVSLLGNAAQASFYTGDSGLSDALSQNGPEQYVSSDIENQLERVGAVLQQSIRENCMKRADTTSTIIERAASGVLGYAVIYLATTELPHEGELLCGVTCRYAGTFLAFCLLHGLLQLRKTKDGHIA